MGSAEGGKPVGDGPDNRLSEAVRSLAPAPAANDERPSIPSDLPTSARVGRGLPAQVAADAELFELLREEDFSGRGWALLEERLARHGLSVLEAWLQTGEVFNQAAERGMHLEPTEFELDELRRWADVRDDLKFVSVARALVSFRQKARDGVGWTAVGGASIDTYFVTGCVYAFVATFSNRRKEERKWATAAVVRLDDPRVSVEELTAAAAQNVADPAERSLVRDLVRAVLESWEPRDKAILWGKVNGKTNQEIAQELGVTEKAVERRWSRLMATHEWARSLSRGGKSV
ncbi:sigma factor-like helix-turn-helix DNA-binding protein [Nocardia gipuzkoensis]